MHNLGAAAGTFEYDSVKLSIMMSFLGILKSRPVYKEHFQPLSSSCCPCPGWLVTGEAAVSWDRRETARAVSAFSRSEAECDSVRVIVSVASPLGHLPPVLKSQVHAYHHNHNSVNTALTTRPLKTLAAK